MTELIENTDIDWQLIIDFESEMCCEAGSIDNGLDDCDKPVEWKVITKCCHGSVLICNDHKVFDEKRLDARSNLIMHCVFCKTYVRAGEACYYEKV